jgi:hypothetical protein
MLGPAVKTDRWYDRHVRSWVVQAKDADDNQVGAAVYVYSRREAIAEEKLMKMEMEQRK